MTAASAGASVTWAALGFMGLLGFVASAPSVAMIRPDASDESIQVLPAYTLVPVQLSMGRKVPPQTAVTRKPSSAPRKSANEPRDVDKQLIETMNRLTPKERKRLAKAINRMTPEERRRFAETVKRELAQKRVTR